MYSGYRGIATACHLRHVLGGRLEMNQRMSKLRSEKMWRLVCSPLLAGGLRVSAHLWYPYIQEKMYLYIRKQNGRPQEMPLKVRIAWHISHVHWNHEYMDTKDRWFPGILFGTELCMALYRPHEPGTNSTLPDRLADRQTDACGEINWRPA